MKKRDLYPLAVTGDSLVRPLDTEELRILFRSARLGDLPTREELSLAYERAKWDLVTGRTLPLTGRNSDKKFYIRVYEESARECLSCNSPQYESTLREIVGNSRALHLREDDDPNNNAVFRHLPERTKYVFWKMVTTKMMVMTA